MHYIISHDKWLKKLNNITNYPKSSFNPDEFTEKVFIMTKELSNCLNWPTKRTWRCVKFKWESIQTEHLKLVEWLNFHCAVQSNYFNQDLKLAKQFIQ